MITRSGAELTGAQEHRRLTATPLRCSSLSASRYQWIDLKPNISHYSVLVSPPKSCPRLNSGVGVVDVLTLQTETQNGKALARFQDPTSINPAPVANRPSHLARQPRKKGGPDNKIGVTRHQRNSGKSGIGLILFVVEL